MQLTIEQLEGLVAELETGEKARKEQLARLIRAYAKIVSLRNPKAFRSMGTELRDVPSSDNSYPPKQTTWGDGPKLIILRDNKTEDVPQSRQFYHEWRRVTTDLGLWVGKDGTLRGCNETGTGTFDHFPAYPGNCNVEVALDWVPLPLASVSVEELEAAEQQMRQLAADTLAAGGVVA